MRLVGILQVKRVDGTFHINGLKIPALRESSPGYGALCMFEPSRLDKDFVEVCGLGNSCWFPSHKELKLIEQELDFSDKLTYELRGFKGWDSGPRVYKVEDFM